MVYKMYNAVGEAIATNYFVELEDNGTLAIWFGAGITDPNREFIAWADCNAKAEDLISRLLGSDRLSESCIDVLWDKDDVMDLLGISWVRAEAFLEKNGKRLNERLFEEGCEIVKILHQSEMEDDDSPNGKNCGNCGRDLNEDIGVDVEDRGWYCYNCAERYNKD